MKLAIFDLDNTLIAGDSDYLWGQFLAENGRVDREAYEIANTEFYTAYQKGCLDIVKFLEFSLKPLAAYDSEILNAWRNDFVETKIRPILLPAAYALIEKHRAKGDLLLIITATNHFITEPIAQLYGIQHLIATIPEKQGKQFTGRFEGIPSFQMGKVTRLKSWLSDYPFVNLADTYFYTDSINDLPLLSEVGHPIAVDPDAALSAQALDKGWLMLTLRDGLTPRKYEPALAGKLM